MSEITYLVGDATAPQGSGQKILAHVCNDAGKWGKGFVLAVTRRWRQPEAMYRAWSRGLSASAPPFTLGHVQFVRVEPQINVANMLGQHGINARGERTVRIRYDSVRLCLQAVAVGAQKEEASVHMPRIGCGLGGGEWEQIETIINEELCQHGIGVVVYDF